MIQNAGNSNGGPIEGGKGGLCTDPKHYRSDAKMIERALRDNYPMTRRKRRVLVAKLFKDFQASTSVSKTIAIARCLLVADGLNVQRERMATPVHHEHSGTIDVDERRIVIIEAIDRECASRDGEQPLLGGNGNGNGNGHKLEPPQSDTEAS